MFTRAIRYNLGSDEQEAVKIYNERAKPMQLQAADHAEFSPDTTSIAAVSNLRLRNV